MSDKHSLNGNAEKFSTRGFRQKLKSIASLNQSSGSRSSGRSAFRPTSTVTSQKLPNRPSSSIEVSQRRPKSESRCHQIENGVQKLQKSVDKSNMMTSYERNRSISPVEKSVLAQKEERRQRKIERARLSRLYLIGRRGPCVFSVVGEDPNIKYTVKIDEKPSCSCGKQYCVHLLFIFMRVLRVRSDDPRIFAHRLTHHQINNLVYQYESQLRRKPTPKERSSRPISRPHEKQAVMRSHSTLLSEDKPRIPIRHQHSKAISDSTEFISGRSKLVNCSLEPNLLRAPIVTLSRESTMSSNQSMDTDGDDLGNCPICLLPMGEEDQLSECQNGCKNKIHTLCLNIWENACHDREFEFTCPLCRSNFKTGLRRAQSAFHVPSFSDISSPDEDDFIRQSVREELQGIVQDLSEDIVDGLASSDQEIVKLALLASVNKFSCSENDHTRREGAVLRVLSGVLKLPFSVCDFCCNQIINLFCFLDSSCSLHLKSIIEQLFLMLKNNDSSKELPIKTAFTKALEKNLNPFIWFHYMILQASHISKHIKSSQDNGTSTFICQDMQELVHLLKMHTWDKIQDHYWPNFVEFLLIPIISCFGHFEKETRNLAKEIISTTAQYCAKEQKRGEYFRGELNKLNPECSKVCNYIDKKMKEQSLKVRLTRQNSNVGLLDEILKVSGGPGCQISRNPSSESSSLRESNEIRPLSKSNDKILREIDFAHFEEGKDWMKGECIGRGGHSLCYVIKAIHYGHMMVVKQIKLGMGTTSRSSVLGGTGVADFKSSSAVEEERKEFEMARQLRHAHIVEVFGSNCSVDNYTFNIYQEWMPGGTVSNHVRHFGPFNQSSLRLLLRQLALAIQYLHDCQVAHRDIKGDNLLLDLTGTTLKLCDFGTASLVSKDGTGPMQFANELVGTVCFMAPEVIRGRGYGRSCDIWSFGCVIIQMAGGMLPWRASQHSNKAALMYQIAMCDQPPPEVETIEVLQQPEHRQLLLLTKQCLQLEPSSRVNASGIVKHLYFVDASSLCSN